MTRPPFNVPTYLAQLTQQIEVRPGELRVVTLYHDDDCPRLRGGDCTCQPDLELLNRKQRRAYRNGRRR